MNKVIFKDLEGFNCTGYINEKSELALHSFDDLPSQVFNDLKLWHAHGKIHRENAPASLDGNDLDICYWFDGARHRLDGPAVVSPDGYTRWYAYGIVAPVSSQEEFEKWLKLRNF